MAINYTNLFTALGKIVKGSNAIHVFSNTDLVALADGLTGFPSSMTDTIDAAADFIALQKSGNTSRVDLKGSFGGVLKRKSTVLDELDLHGANLTDREFFQRLWRDMAANGQSIEKSSCSIGSATAASWNVGNGTILKTNLLDGYSSPLDGHSSSPLYPANENYANVESELMLSEDIAIECALDSFTGGATSGQEEFQVSGAKGGRGFVATEGSEAAADRMKSVVGLSTIGLDGAFEGWVASEPTGWTLDAGSDRISENTSGYRGSALRVTGDGLTTTVTLSKELNGGAKGLRGHWLVARYKGSHVDSADLSIKLVGTGYTPGGTEVLSVSSGALATSWTGLSCFLIIPKSYASDFRLQIEFTNLANTKTVDVDDVFLSPAYYFGGAGWGYQIGSTAAVNRDRWTIPLTLSTAKVFQTYFRRAFGVQLRSNAVATIADSLAT